MKLNTPEVSVVIPAYRAEAFIGRAIRSVVDQVGVNAEIIVVVDGVYDCTAEVADTFPETRVIVNEVNRGASAARNQGLAAANALFVQFLDADDFLEGPLLSGLLSQSVQEELDVAFGRAFFQSLEGRRREMEIPRIRDPMEIIREWLGMHFVPPCAILWRTGFIRKIGGWREDLSRNQDGELVWRGLLAGAKLGHCQQGAGIYVQHHGPRITAARDNGTLQSSKQIIDWLVSELKCSERLDELMRRALISHLYFCMFQSYWLGHERMALEFEARWRDLGGRQHEGTWLHRSVCNLVGLRRKQKISDWAASSKFLGRAMRQWLGPLLFLKG